LRDDRLRVLRFLSSLLKEEREGGPTAISQS
jgi:hypothetical protein